MLLTRRNPTVAYDPGLRVHFHTKSSQVLSFLLFPTV